MSVLTTKEAANFMKVSSRQVALMIKAGEIPDTCYRVVSLSDKKKHYRFFEENLKRWFLKLDDQINVRKLARIA